MVTLNCVIECKELVLWVLGFLGTFVWLVIVYFIKPSITIKEPILENSNSVLKIPVMNYGYFDAVNIKIEACAIDNAKNTYHFLLDNKEFIAIPSKKCSVLKNDSHERIFKSRDLTPSTSLYYMADFNKIVMQLCEGGYTLRVRIHSCHSFTGFGRLQESHFKYQVDKFVHVKV